MATYRWAVRHTGRPFGPAEKLEPEDFKHVISQHTTYATAERRLVAERADMREACGLNAWSDHFGIFPLEPVRYTGTAKCRICGKRREVSFTWEPDTFDPWPELQDSLCPECEKLSPEEAYLVANARWRREYPEEAAVEDEWQAEQASKGVEP